MLKVFLVEDESVIREGLRDNIPWEQYGYNFVGEAGDGEMALPLIRKTRPDVLITDIKMPFMDGLSLSKIVTTEFPKTKIIIISGYDDFEYAREAIEVGVDQFLLKPITRLTLKKVLIELKEKIEQENDQNDYQTQFQNEMYEYEQFARRHFFEKILEGEMSVKQIYEEAAKLSLDLDSSMYNILFLSFQEKNDLKSNYDDFSIKQDEILHYFLRSPHYILFSWNINCYGVLIKSDNREKMEKIINKGLEHIKKVCESEDNKYSWHVAVGNAVERLSMLPKCYQSVNHSFAFRFIMPNQHIFTNEILSSYLNNSEDQNIDSVQASKMNPEIIRDFLLKGNVSEINEFVEYYLQGIKEALVSNMFRDYVILNIRFTVQAYVESLGASQEDYKRRLKKIRQDMYMQPNEVADYFADMLEAAMSIRDEETDYQSKKILRRALAYIDENYNKEELSLNLVANKVNVSSNYFSAIFSQSMQKTFIEYVTSKRMEKAKHLLKTTDMSAGDISLEVGYKDPHYFSFVFKKTQGCSPRDYRSVKK